MTYKVEIYFGLWETVNEEEAKAYKEMGMKVIIEGERSLEDSNKILVYKP